MKRKPPYKMFALLNLGTIKHVAYRRRDCVTFGRECFQRPAEYDKFIRKGWFKVVPVEVTPRDGDGEGVK